LKSVNDQSSFKQINNTDVIHNHEETVKFKQSEPFGYYRGMMGNNGSELSSYKFYSNGIIYMFDLLVSSVKGRNQWDSQINVALILSLTYETVNVLRLSN